MARRAAILPFSTAHLMVFPPPNLFVALFFFFLCVCVCVAVTSCWYTSLKVSLSLSLCRSKWRGEPQNKSQKQHISLSSCCSVFFFLFPSFFLLSCLMGWDWSLWFVPVSSVSSRFVSQRRHFNDHFLSYVVFDGKNESLYLKKKKTQSLAVNSNKTHENVETFLFVLLSCKRIFFFKAANMTRSFWAQVNKQTQQKKRSS